MYAVLMAPATCIASTGMVLSKLRLYCQGIKPQATASPAWIYKATQMCHHAQLRWKLSFAETTQHQVDPTNGWCLWQEAGLS
jgi:hypothetical protein